MVCSIEYCSVSVAMATILMQQERIREIPTEDFAKRKKKEKTRHESIKWEQQRNVKNMQDEVLRRLFTITQSKTTAQTAALKMIYRFDPAPDLGFVTNVCISYSHVFIPKKTS